MTRRRRAVEPTTLALREELDAIAHRYHHVHRELEQKGLESSVRRRLQDEAADLRARCDRLLDEWVPEDELRKAWRAHLQSRGAAPDGPPAIRPLAFQGIDDAGSLVQVRGKGNDEFEVLVDGGLAERVAASKDFASGEPVLRFRRGGRDVAETFGASDEALTALADFVDRAGPAARPTPPWDFASELLADGLIDVHFELTPRGRRALAAWETR